MSRHALAAIAVLSLGLCWGGEIVIGKYFVASGERELVFPFYMTAGSAVLSFSAQIGHTRSIRTLKVNIVQFKAIVATALTLVTIPYAATYYALRELSPQETSLIICTTPFAAFLISAVRKQSMPHPIAFAGAVVGLIGIVFLLDFDRQSDGAGLWWFAIAGIAPVSYAVSSFLIGRTYQAGIGYLELAFYSNLLTSLIYLAALGGDVSLSNFELDYVIILLGAMMLNIAATSLLFFAASALPPVAVTVSNYSTVAFSALFAWLFLGDTQIGSTFLFSTVLVYGGATFVLRYSRNSASEREA